jgi:hypothetical protein
MKKLSQTDPTVAVCIAIALGATLTYAIVGAVAGSAMYSDSGWGFLGWDNATACRSTTPPVRTVPTSRTTNLPS